MILIFALYPCYYRIKANICWCSGVSLLIKSKSIPDTLQLRPQTCYFRTQIRRKKILLKKKPLNFEIIYFSYPVSSCQGHEVILSLRSCWSKKKKEKLSNCDCCHNDRSCSDYDASPRCRRRHQF